MSRQFVFTLVAFLPVVVATGAVGGVSCNAISGVDGPVFGTGTGGGGGNVPHVSCDGGPEICDPAKACATLSTECKPFSLVGDECKGDPAPDTKPCTEGTMAGFCDGHGLCASCSDNMKNGDEEDVDCGGTHCLACDGATCSASDACKSGRCAGDVCLKQDGAACMVDAECATSRCVMGTCEPCAGSADCVSEQCDASTGRCKAPPGAPCNDDEMCKNLTCNTTTGLCQKDYQGACSNSAGCTTGYCYSEICLYCTDSSQCLSGECIKPMGNTTGSCALKQGAFCTPGSAPCAMGLTCMGSPGTCQ